MAFDLPTLLAHESDRVEWKATLAESPCLQAVSALANDLGNTGAPGYLVVGVENDGQVRGVGTSPAEIDEAQVRVSAWVRSVNLLPQPSVDVSAVRVDGAVLIVVTVAPYTAPPAVKVKGVAWVRVGSTTRRAHDADLARIRERRPVAQRPFDVRPVPNATLDELDLAWLTRAHEAERAADVDHATFPPLERWLVQRDLARVVDRAVRPTYAGVLLYGREPRTWVPGAFIEFVRYAGRGFESDVVFRKTVTGTLGDQLEAAWDLVRAQTVQVSTGVQGAKEQFQDQYPVDALRELVRNLVQHRAYEGTNAPARIAWLEDAVVFNNPGGPFGQAAQGEFGDHSDYRNPTITAGLVELGYVQRLGRGVRVVRALLAKNGNPPLVVETDGFTTLTVRRRG